MSEHLNKIPKETLTIQNIKQDIKELYKPSISVFFVFGILGAIFLLLGVYSIIFIPNSTTM